MPHYICLMRFTQRGLAEIRDSTARAAVSKTRVEKLGGRSVSFYLTMGAYDVVQIFEMPSEAAMMEYLLTARSDGHVDPLVLPAFDEAQYGAIIQAVAAGS